MEKDYFEIANQYIDDVLEGKVTACKFVKQACQRQYDDLRKSNEELPYSFDLVKANRICRFIENMPHVKGKWAKATDPKDRLIKMEPWQVFIWSTVFGWVNTDGTRRFKTAYLEVARKNAKSTILSAIANYLTSADEEMGANVYSAATTREQARIVFNDAKQMADRSEGYRKRYGVTTLVNSVVQESTGSFFRAVSADSSTLDGLNVSGGIVDELHAHKTRTVWDVLETATGSRSQPLIVAITTSGSNRTGICYEQRDYVRRILTGNHKDEEYFGIIYTVDDEDLENRADLFENEELWKKSNPNLDVSVSRFDLRRKALKAMQMASAQNNFLTKHLDVWVNANTAWMDLTQWDSCADPTLKLSDFERDECMIGLDLASKLDIMAMILLFRRMIGGRYHYYLFGKYFLPMDTIEGSTNASYAGWEEDGRLISSPGPVNDFDLLEAEIVDANSLYEVQRWMLDPKQAAQLIKRMGDKGIILEEVQQSVANFSEPMKEIEALVAAGELHHNGCPIMGWMVGNVVCHRNAKDEIYPRKEFYVNKIDGVVAGIMAMRGWIDGAAVEQNQVYEQRGLRTL